MSASEIILCIDTSISPAVGAVVQFNSDTVTPHNIDQASSLKQNDSLNILEQIEFQEKSKTDLLNSDVNFQDNHETPVFEFGDFFTKWKDKIDSCVIVLDSKQFLALKLELPIKDLKSINKVIETEVQDLLPFDTDKFLIQHKVLPSHDPKNSDIHVGIYPKEKIQNFLKLCGELKIEPAILTTPTSAASAVFQLDKNQELHHRASILNHGGFIHCSTWLDGVTKIERAIPLQASDLDQVPGLSTVSELAQVLFNSEQKYGQPIDEITLIGNHLPVEIIKQVMNRPVTQVSLPSDIRPNATTAVLGSIFGQKKNEGLILTNLRTKQFAFNPLLKPLKELFSKLTPYLLICFCSWFIYLGGLYISREFKISSLYSAAYGKVKEALPDTNNTNKKDIVELLKQENTKLEQQLKDLGSPAAVNPYDAMIKITEFIANPNFTIRKIDIKGNKITVEGTVPGYQDIEKIEKDLKKESAFFCRIKKETGNSIASQQDRKTFSLEVWLCE